MPSRSRRLSAAAIVPLLVLGLAACAGAEPAAAPTATAMPTPTVEPAPQAKPGSRIPLSCEQLAAAPSDVGAVTVMAVDWAIELVLAGFANCRLAASVAGLPVQLELAVIPEVTAERVTFLSVDNPYEPSTFAFAGDGSGAGCQAFDGEAVFCEAVAFAQQYTVVVNLHPDGDSVPAEPALAALAGAVSALVAALDEAGEPLPEWDAGPNVLTYPTDCMTEMAAVDQPIIAALPFESTPATMVGSGDGPLIYSVAARRVSTTACEWYTIGSGSYASVSLEVLPGAEFAIDDGRFSPQGTEVDVPGTERAWQTVTENGRFDLTFVVDRSIVTVRYSPPFDGSDPDPPASMLAVVDAVIATGPRS